MSAIPASSDARVRTGVLPAADVLLADGTVAVDPGGAARGPARPGGAARRGLGRQPAAAVLRDQPPGGARLRGAPLRGRRRRHHRQPRRHRAGPGRRAARPPSGWAPTWPRWPSSSPTRCAGRGVGSLLLEHLAAAARDQGVRRFVAEVLAENSGMLRRLPRRRVRDRPAHRGGHRPRRDGHRRLGPRGRGRRRAGVPLGGAARWRRCSTRGRWPSPGCGATAPAIGAAVLRSITAGGFTGDLCVVHPEADAIAGVTAYPHLADVPGHVDLVVVAVPADPGAGDARRRRGRGRRRRRGHLLGLRGARRRGRARSSARCSGLARDHSIRLVGPNCLGLMCNHPDVAAQRHVQPGRCRRPEGWRSPPSPAGSASRSSTSPASSAWASGSFVSLGNKADVSGNDLLAAWRDDPRVSAAALYLESFGNAPEVRPRRPPVRRAQAAAGGRRRPLGRAAGGPAPRTPPPPRPPAVGVDALFAQAGVIGCRSAEEMAETALLLAEQAAARAGRGSPC